MAIQMRRGNYDDFDPLKMRVGEWAVAIDSDSNKQIVWMCFAPGVVKRMGTVEDFNVEIQRLIHDQMESINTSVSNANQSETNAKNSEDNAKLYSENAKQSEENAKKYMDSAEEYKNASYNSATNASTSEANALESSNLAGNYAQESARTSAISESKASEAAISASNASASETNANNYAIESKSWAIGGTDTRENEDTDNSKYYSIKSNEFAELASESKTNAKASEDNAKTSETNALNSASNASESEKNAKYYMEKSKEYSGQAAQGVPIATEEVPGKTKPDGITLTIDSEGTLKVVSDSQLDESSENPIQNKAVTQALNNLELNVPKLVKVDNKTVFMAEDGTLSAKGGSSIAPKPTVEPTITNGNAKVTLKWSDPEDSIIDGITLSTWAGTKLVMNENNYPADENDGTLIVDNKERDKYKTDGLVISELENGKTYYFALFPYNTDEIYNYQTTNRLLGNPSLVKLDPCTNMSITTAMGKATIKWTDPEASKTVDGNTATWVKTVLVYKEGSVAPTSPSDGNIAVEETTRNTYQSSGYEVSGLANGLQYSFSLFAISNENSISDPTSVNARLWSSVVVTTEESSLYGQNVTLTYGESSKTVTFSSTGTASVEVPYIGEVNISAADGSDTATTKVTITAFEQSYSVELSFLKIVTFANGTYEEIAAMVNAHYADKINIADYWAVGDTRNVALSAMSATGVGESHRAQTVQFVIGDFEHDELATPINGHTKTAVTLLQKDCLMDATSASNSNNGSDDTEKGYMNSSNTSVGGWKSCARRTWCNNVYFSALPSALQSIVKTVNKKVSVGNNSSTIETVQDKIFLAAEIEIYGSTTHSFAGEGTQYQYYKNATVNRYKMPKWSSSYVSHRYWERSPRSGNTSSFCRVQDDGSAHGNVASHAYGLAPCLNL